MLSSGYNNTSDADKMAINNFREYLKIPSVHPNINYDKCIAFLQKQANSLNLPYVIHYCKPRNPILIISWIGSDPNLQSVLLNSHMDVVPVFEDKWKHAPFAAHVDKQGNIYGRGTQDMKSVGIQYLEAIRRLKCDNIRLRRTVHISFMPDEERGGELGMRVFVKTEEFTKLNVGFALDEGMPSIDNTYKIFYGERTCWRFHIHCEGEAGDASLSLNKTASEKVQYLLHKFYDFRDQEKKKLNINPDLTIGDVTTVNLTIMQGGLDTNIIPDKFIITFDTRIAMSMNLKDWEDTINQWCKEAGEGVSIDYDQKHPQVPVTKLEESNIYWIAFKSVFNQLGLVTKTEIFPAGTDCRYIRAAGIPALGFSPIRNTPTLLHDHNEYLNVNVFLNGIELYYKIIKAVADC